MQVESDLGWARKEFYTLAVQLWELALNHAIFEEPAFSNEAMDELVPLGSWRSQKMHGLYKETRNNSICLQVCIKEIEQSTLVAWKRRPLSPGSAAKPVGWGEWGGAGIVTNLNPPVLGTNRGHDQGTSTSPPDNDADRQGRVSTGGGPAGARVRRQHGQEYTRQRFWIQDQGVAPGMEPEDNQWGCLVHPPQLQCIPQTARVYTNLNHEDIQGEPVGDPGVQQQQGSVQEIWGESRWEEIVCVS